MSLPHPGAQVILPFPLIQLSELNWFSYVGGCLCYHKNVTFISLLVFSQSNSWGVKVSFHEVLIEIHKI